MTDMMELEERAKATPGWTWEMAGIVGSFALISGERAAFVIVEVPRRGLFVWSPTDTTVVRASAFIERHPDARPDFTSAATRGCVLEMVREAWRNTTIIINPCRSGWMAMRTENTWGRLCGGPLPSESQALAYALEQAPYGRHTGGRDDD